VFIGKKNSYSERLVGHIWYKSDQFNRNLYKGDSFYELMKPEYLLNWNPWWTTKEVPSALKGIFRSVNPLIFKALPEREIMALTGIRRSGKTTLMYQLVESLLTRYQPAQILYLNLDDELLKRESLESIYSFYREHKNPEDYAFIFLDEIQNAVGWEKFLKKYYDLREKVKFIISGSSANLLKGEYSTLLTGRNLTFEIYPLSFSEFLKFGHIDFNEPASALKAKILFQLDQYFEFGGFPEIYFKPEELKKLVLKQYFDDIIYKDLVKRYNINAQKITDLAVYLFTNIGNSFSIRNLRNCTGLSTDSIKDYLSDLEEAYMLLVLDYFSYSLKEQSQFPKKAYCLDCGLRNSVGFRFSSDSGWLAENCVVAELRRTGQQAYYWKNKGEVDFILKEKNQDLTAINVSYTDEIPEREIKALLEFKKEFKNTTKLILITKEIEKTEQGITLIPLWKWLLTEKH